MSDVSNTPRADIEPRGLTPDAVRLFGAIFEPTDVVEIRPVEIYLKSGKDRKTHVFYRQRRWRSVAHHASTNYSIYLASAAPKNVNLFFGVNPRAEEGEGYGLAWQIRTVRVLWADLDDVTPDQALAACESAGLPRPTAIVNSGGGCHLYWMLSDPYLIDDVGKPAKVYDVWPDKKDESGGKKKPPTKSTRVNGELVRERILDENGQPTHRRDPRWPTLSPKNPSKNYSVILGRGRIV